MKKILLSFAILCSTLAFSQAEPFNFDLDWATFFYCPEGNDISTLASAMDDSKNLYITGGINESCATFPDNDPIYNYYGMQDAYIAKFNRSGNLEWFKYYGGSDAEITGAIKIVDNHIYLGGRIASTDSSLNFNNDYSGNGDGFVSKLTLDGEILWSTYIGGEGSDYVDALDVNDDGEIFVIGSSTSLRDLGTPYTFQPENIVPDNHRSGYVANIDAQGNKVWASYYGENMFGFIRSIAVGETGVYLMGIDMTFEAGNYYGTAGSHKENTGADVDNFIAKFSFEGNRLWGTYFGGSGTEGGISPFSIVTFNNMVYFCGYTSSETDIATPGAQQELIGGIGSMFLTKMDANGNVEWGTYAGIRHPSIIESYINTTVNVDEIGNLYLSGTTNLSGLASSDGYKSTITVGDHEAFVTKYSSQGEMQWGTYFGGVLLDGGGQTHFSDDSFMFTGYSHNPDIATPNAFLENLNPNGMGRNEIIVKFGPPQIGIDDNNKKQFVLWPNPTDNFLTINSSEEIKEIKIYDIIGKLIRATSFKNETETSIDVSGLSPGTYILQAITENGIQMEKVIKR